MNVLGIDHGSKRVGLAIGSTDAGVAAPLKLLDHHGEAALIEDIKAVIVSERVDHVVVGLPISKDGRSTEQTEIARAFAAKLEEALDVPVVLEDERLSSREIEAHMEAMGGKKAWKASGLDRDTAAATLFLQSFLDRMKTE
ncbi:MAG: Holliday junction resolvase RuvX [Patescibacteria group bacterium]|nr:MAG: Holliday junction resolvase RuvX [Patescibacteria group bacterium]